MPETCLAVVETSDRFEKMVRKLGHTETLEILIRREAILFGYMRMLATLLDLSAPLDELCDDTW